MSNNNFLKNQMDFLNGYLPTLKISNGIETSTERKSELELKISKTLAYVNGLPINMRENALRKNLDMIIDEESKDRTNDELFDLGISVDQQLPQIDIFLAPKEENYAPQETLFYNKPKNWGEDYAENIERRIAVGNEARNFLNNADILNFSPEILAEYTKTICEGRSASWIYVNKNLGLAVTEAKKFAKMNNAAGDIRFDILQDSAITMFEAAQKYDTAKNCSISSFSTLVIKRRMPRFAKKYVTLFHVSEEDYRKAFDQHIKEKTQQEESSEEHGQVTEFEILTDSDSLDAVIDETNQPLYETIPDEKMGDPKKIAENRAFWDLFYQALDQNGYPRDWASMYKEIVVYDGSPADYAEEFGVTERTIRNRIYKMSETIRTVFEQQPEIYNDIINFETRSEAAASDPFGYRMQFFSYRGQGYHRPKSSQFISRGKSPISEFTSSSFSKSRLALTNGIVNLPKPLQLGSFTG